MKKSWKIILCAASACILVMVLAVILWHGAGKQAVQIPGEDQQNVDPNEIVTVWCLSEVWTGKVGEEKKLAYTYEYDANGNMLSQTTYWAKIYERDTSVNRYEFDDRGNLTYLCMEENHEVFYTYDEKDRLLTKTELWHGEENYHYCYTYDESGRVLTMMERRDGRESVTVSAYDLQGNMVKREYINSKGEVSRREMYTYDQSGKMLTEKCDWINEPNRSSESYYQYDEMGNELSYKWYQAGKLRTERTNTYDFFGRQKTTKPIENGRVTYEATYTYDIKGNIVQIESMEGPLVTVDMPYELQRFVTTYRYDKNGNMIERVTESERMGTSVHTWHYDEHGNLLLEEYDVWRTERTYDEWGNILTKRYRPSSGPEKETEYTYVSFQVPRWLAEKIRAWQQDYLDKQGYVA